MEKLSRRDVLKSAALPIAAAATRTKSRKPGKGPQVIVVGAGAFGGWTALHLLRGGARVTLLEAWGAGNSRASSGGETRVIRSIYGGDPDYISWVARSLTLWRQWKAPIYHRTGALWMFSGDDQYARASLPLVKLPVDQLSAADAAKRFPQINFAGVRSVYYEHEAGYLLARRGCASVQEAFVREGGDFRLGSVHTPVDVKQIALDDGTRLTADAIVFACGPWLGKLFPEAIGDLVAPSRQEVFFFGTPPGDRRFIDMPVWVDFGERIFYGIPGNDSRGFKVADDTRGDPVDPTTLERIASVDGLARARQELTRRFPDLATAPLVESRVCQYENSPDGNFIIDQHPGAPSVFIAGGGSGHGYKIGPALGEYLAGVILGKRKLMERFRLSRFAGKERKPSRQMEHL
jgi:glycine/D-amino acid oxidase-like deaminating enzyme